MARNQVKPTLILMRKGRSEKREHESLSAAQAQAKRIAEQLALKPNPAYQDFWESPQGDTIMEIRC